MMLVEEAAPDAGALPVAALRGYLRLATGFEMATDAAEDAALAGFLRAAIATIEARTGKVLLRRPFRLRLAPVASVEAVEVTDAAGQVAAIEAGAWRLVPDSQRPALVGAGGWLPAVPSNGFVTVRFTAGFGETWAGVPADLAQAAIMLAARYHEDRGEPQQGAAVPFAVGALLDRWRQVRTLAGRGGRA